jgi:hypothetical protein
MKFAQRVFAVAGVYGLIVLLPQYFLETKISADHPPAITHPEYFYGFIGVALAWQLAFLLIARDPVRYRLLMLPSILEKVSFAGAAAVLYFQQRVAAPVFFFGMLNLVLGALFVVAFAKTRA